MSQFAYNIPVIGTLTPSYGSSGNNIQNNSRHQNNSNDDDDEQPLDHRPVGVEHLPPRQELSKGTIAATFDDILAESTTDKDIFRKSSIDCAWCCTPSAGKSFITLGFFLIVASIIVIILMVEDVVTVQAVIAPTYGLLIGLVFLAVASLQHESVYEVDKREKVVRTRRNFTFFTCWNSFPSFVNVQQISFEEIDFVSVDLLRDGFFDEDFVEDPTVLLEEKKKKLQSTDMSDDAEKTEEEKNDVPRVPVKIARRNAWKADEEKKKANKGAAAAAVVVTIAENNNQEKNTDDSPPAGSSQKETDDWLRGKYFKPSRVGGEHHNMPVHIRLYRRGYQSEVYLNNRVKYPNGTEDKRPPESILLEEVNPSDARRKIADWEAYFSYVGVPHLRRAVPPMTPPNRRLLNPYDAEIEEIQTATTLKGGKMFWLLIIPTGIFYALLLTLTVVFSQDSVDRLHEQQQALRNASAGFSNSSRGSSHGVPELLAYQSATLGSLGGFLCFWMLFIVWWFTRKVVLIADKRSKVMHYKMSRYMCNCSCCDDGENENEDNSANNKNNNKNGSMVEVSFKFEQIHSLQIKRSGGRGKLDNCVIKIYYCPRGYTPAMYKMLNKKNNKKQNDPSYIGPPPLRSVVVGSVLPEAANKIFRGWKRYLLEDLKVLLSYQPEDAAFALLRRNDAEENVNSIPLAPAKQLDPSLYVFDEEDDKQVLHSPIIF